MICGRNRRRNGSRTRRRRSDRDSTFSPLPPPPLAHTHGTRTHARGRRRRRRRRCTLRHTTLFLAALAGDGTNPWGYAGECSCLVATAAADKSAKYPRHAGPRNSAAGRIDGVVVDRVVRLGTSPRSFANSRTGTLTCARPPACAGSTPCALPSFSSSSSSAASSTASSAAFPSASSLRLHVHIGSVWCAGRRCAWQTRHSLASACALRC